MSPTTSNTPRLGDLERAVMEHLWASSAEHPDGATVREVLERFEGQREIAYTTVMTVLDRLAKKKVVERVLVGRAWFYQPAVTRADLVAEEIVSLLASSTVAQRQAVWECVLRRYDPESGAISDPPSDLN